MFPSVILRQQCSIFLAWIHRCHSVANRSGIIQVESSLRTFMMQGRCTGWKIIYWFGPVLISLIVASVLIFQAVCWMRRPPPAAHLVRRCRWNLWRLRRILRTSYFLEKLRIFMISLVRAIRSHRRVKNHSDNQDRRTDYCCCCPLLRLKFR